MAPLTSGQSAVADRRTVAGNRFNGLPAWQRPEHELREDRNPLGWTISKRPVMTECGLSIPNRVATVRNDTEQVLGLVGRDYTPIQPADAMDVFRAVADAAGAPITHAGTIDNGERIWAVAQMPVSLTPTAGDIVDVYLRMSNGYDGGTAYDIDLQMLRLACNNGLVAVDNLGRLVHAIHTASLLQITAHLDQVIERARHAVETIGIGYQQMSRNRPTSEQVNEVLAKLFPAETPAQERRAEQAKTTVQELYHGSATCRGEGVEGTGWGLYNALTEYNQHYRSTAQTDTERRLRSQWYGAAAEFDQQAYQLVASLN